MNNFTPRAQQVLALACKESDRLNHNHVGTEHLLLGLTKLNNGLACNVLQKLLQETIKDTEILETLRAEVKKRTVQGDPANRVNQVPFTPRVKKILALAAKEARALHHSYVGTEHILLGMIREGEGVPALVFREFRLSLDKVRNEVLKELDPSYTSPEDIPQEIRWLLKQANDLCLRHGLDLRSFFEFRFKDE